MLLELKNISKSYNNFQALSNISFSIKKGEVIVLLGRNGSGKTTLLHILAGIEKSDYGNIYYRGKKVNLNNPVHAKQIGIGVVYQKPELVHELTVGENIFFDKFKNFKQHKNKTIHDINLPQSLICFKKKIQNMWNKKVTEISIAEKQLIQFVKLFVHDLDIIILDEPMAFFSNSENEKICNMIVELKKLNKTVIYSSHNLKKIKTIGDRALILKDGELVSEYLLNSCNEKELLNKIVGDKIRNHYPKMPINLGNRIMIVEDLNNNKIHNINFTLHQGEILGIAGLMGSGKTSLARAILGLNKRSGNVYVGIEDNIINNIKDATNYKVVFMPEDRDYEGLFLNHNIFENVITNKNINCFTYNTKKNYSKISLLLHHLGMDVNKMDNSVQNLSNGEKQKVLLARCLHTNSKVFIIDEPTKGLDISTKVEVYNIINELVMNERSIVLLSSDFSELVGMCDRILVMYKGYIVKELSKNDFSEEVIYQYASGLGHAGY